jgi:hypothetical protein
MKTLPKLGIALLFAAAIAWAAPELKPIAVSVGPYEFVEGDSVVIDQVFCTSAKLEIGDTVVVRGRYTLASHQGAKLGLSLTRTESRVLVPIKPGANKNVATGSGEFELVYEVTQIGCMRVALSDLDGGQSFGTVYFGTPNQLATVNRSPRGTVE